MDLSGPTIKAVTALFVALTGLLTAADKITRLLFFSFSSANKKRTLAF